MSVSCAVLWVCGLARPAVLCGRRVRRQAVPVWQPYARQHPATTAGCIQLASVPHVTTRRSAETAAVKFTAQSFFANHVTKPLAADSECGSDSGSDFVKFARVRRHA